jgi:hypothetical protein
VLARYRSLDCSRIFACVLEAPRQSLEPGLRQFLIASTTDRQVQENDLGGQGSELLAHFGDDLLLVCVQDAPELHGLGRHGSLALPAGERHGDGVR